MFSQRASERSVGRKPERTDRKKTRVLIADREAIFRFGLRRILSTENDLRVVAEAENATEALHLARQAKPQVIFLQAGLALEKVADLILRLRSGSPGCKLVIAAAELSEGESVGYIRAGASGVILKSVEPALFIKCVRKVRQNEIWLPKQEVTHMAKELEGAPVSLPRPADTLTRREKMIISYLTQGWRNREIADHLSISEQTVKNHLRAVYDKVGVSDRLELVLYVIYQRIELPSAELPVEARN
ncbi:MAG: LuxR C-terminal-related transcriptional regulator [Terriglobia bacterium]